MLTKPLTTLMLFMLITAGLLSTCTIFQQASASTVNSCIISAQTTWTKSDSPIKLAGPIAVAEGAKLTIEAGVTVDLNGFYLQINGSLNALGTKDDLVTFKNGYVYFTTKSESWNENSQSGSILMWVNSLAPINVEGSSPKIAASVIEQLTLKNRSSTVVDCTLGKLYADGDETIMGNVICSIDVNGAPYISQNKITDALNSYKGTPIIYRNNIARIYACMGSPTIWNNTINYLLSSRFGGAVDISSDGYLQFCHNHVLYPIEASNPYANYGSTPWDDYRRTTQEPSFTTYGIKIGGYGDVLLSNNLLYGTVNVSVSISSYGDITLMNNSFSSGITADRYRSLKINFSNIYSGGVVLSGEATRDVDAQNNYWGTTDTHVIDQAIVDKSDDYNLRKVTYEPILTELNRQAAPNYAAPLPIATPNPAAASTPLTPADQRTTPPTLNWLVVVIAFSAAAVAVLLRLWLCLCAVEDNTESGALIPYSTCIHTHTAKIQHETMLGCARKHRCHTISDKEQRSEPKKLSRSVAVLWCRKTRHTHKEKSNCPPNKKGAEFRLRATGSLSDLSVAHNHIFLGG